MSHRPSWNGALIMLALAVGCVTSRATVLAPRSTPVLIRGARVFDGYEMVGVHDVLVRGDRIVEVGTVAPTASVPVINGTGMTLLPGLIDSHVHLWASKQLLRAVVFGVTTLIDMGENASVLTALKAWRTTHSHEAAHFLSAGSPVTAPDGHGTEFGYSIPTLGPGDDVQGFVDARIAQGSDFIKIMYTPASNLPSISREQLASAVIAAHGRGKLVAVHIATLDAAMDVIDAGADTVAHVFADRPPTAGFAAARRIAVITTLSVHARKTGHPIWPSLAVDPALAPYCTAEELDELTKLRPYSPPPGAPARDYAAAEAGVRALQSTHVVLAGTDAGDAHGITLHGELGLMVQAGLSAIQVLRAATSLAATHWRLGDRGRIAPGFRADLLLVRGDPTSDIHATRAIEAVWVAGQRVHRPRGSYRDDFDRSRPPGP